MEMDKKIIAHIQKMGADTRSTLMPFFADPSADKWLRDVLTAYFRYFLRIGKKPETDRAAKTELRSSLQGLVPAGNRRSLDKMEQYLSTEFSRKGYYFLGGK